MMRSHSRRRKRQGAAVVEFALVTPILFTLVLGAIEFGRTMMSLELLANAARHGCRVGAMPNNDNSTIQSAVNSALQNAGISGATTQITVNGQPVDAGAAVSGDQVAVSVSVPYTQVSWLPVSWFMGTATLSNTVVMRRE